MTTDPLDPVAPWDSPSEPEGNPLLPFLREPVEYCGLVVTRYTAMEFEQECGSDEDEILYAMSASTQPGPAIPHVDAMRLLRKREAGRWFQAQPELDLEYPLQATASREAPF